MLKIKALFHFGRFGRSIYASIEPSYIPDNLPRKGDRIGPFLIDNVEYGIKPLLGTVLISLCGFHVPLSIEEIANCEKLLEDKKEGKEKLEKYKEEIVRTRYLDDTWKIFTSR